MKRLTSLLLIAGLCTVANAQQTPDFWCWYESSRGSDSKGPLAGVRYDGWLTKADITVKSLGQKTAQNKRRIKSVTLLGSTEAVTWQQTKDALTITKPQAVPSPEAVVFKVTFK